MEDNNFKYINTKQELKQLYEPSYNEMQLFECGEHPNIVDLKAFCLNKRKSIINGYWHIVTFFDSENNAAFAELPITSMYSNSDNLLKHIKAVYTFNTVNQYSKLVVYDTNQLEGMPTEIDIV